MKQSEHGGNQPSEILDFSANINPLGMPENVRKILTENIEKFTQYPDPYCTELTEKLSEHENCTGKNIVCGNGADDLIYRIVHALKPERALLVAPTFSEYEKALKEVKCKIKFHTLQKSENFRITSRISDDLCGVDIFFLCNPNNPTGSLISRELLENISEQCIKKNILVAADECFLDFTGKRKDYSMPLNENTIILKAFTKIYAMAGLRLGYMISGSTELAEKVRNIGQYWSVSVPAQLAGTAALNETDYIEKSVSLIKNERNYLYSSLKETGITVYPSETNYLLLHCPFPLDELLYREKIAVRNCGNYRGLDKNYFRIAVRNHDENIKLVNAVKKITEGLDLWQNQ